MELRKENLQDLSLLVRKAGFPEELLSDLGKKIMEGKEPSFSLPYATTIEGHAVKGELYFKEEYRKGDLKWEEFTMQVPKESKPLIAENKFLVGQGYDTTLREAYNLLHGRFVYREPTFDPGRNYWLRLDFGKEGSGYLRLNFWESTFKVEQGLAGSPLNFYLKPAAKKELLDALRQGDRKELDLSVSGVAKKIWAEASPVLKKIRLSDARDETIELPAFNKDVQLEVKRQPSKGRRH